MDSESAIRIAAFTGVFTIMAIWEWFLPRRARSVSRSARWPHNLALLVVDVIALRILIPGAAVAVALHVEMNDWGLLNAWPVPPWLSLVIAVILLDLVVYFQHVLFHSVPTLWRLHRVHHADLDFDVTTGTRFHPLEILVSAGIKCAAVAAIGASPISVLVFEVLLNATAMFNHANARLPVRLDRWLRWIVVTPDMHRVHHSINYNESSSNFGFNAPWWDRFFGTYRDQPAAGHEDMVIGVDAFRTRDDLRIDRLLTQPWQESPGGYSINRRPEPTS